MDLIVDNGKVIEPNFGQKIKAKVKRDQEARVILSSSDLQQLVVNKIHADTPWLEKYTRGSLRYNLDTDTFTVTFTVPSDDTTLEGV